MAQYYEIKINGLLDPHWINWFEGMTLSHLEGDQTLISGYLPDQVALHSLLERIRDLNLRLISLTCGCPDTHYPKNGGSHEHHSPSH